MITAREAYSLFKEDEKRFLETNIPHLDRIVKKQIDAGEVSAAIILPKGRADLFMSYLEDLGYLDVTKTNSVISLESVKITFHWDLE